MQKLSQKNCLKKKKKEEERKKKKQSDTLLERPDGEAAWRAKALGLPGEGDRPCIPAAKPSFQTAPAPATKHCNCTRKLKQA